MDAGGQALRTARLTARSSVPVLNSSRMKQTHYHLSSSRAYKHKEISNQAHIRCLPMMAPVYTVAKEY